MDLAVETFDLAYQMDASHKHLNFLELMTGMEILLSPTEHIELRYRVSRNAAVLLGENRLQATKIFERMKKLYDLRSNIVHGGKRVVADEQLIELQNYFRWAIRTICLVDMNRSDIISWLNSHGFGDKIGV